jgi:hypothetical protein
MMMIPAKWHTYIPYNTIWHRSARRQKLRGSDIFGGGGEGVEESGTKLFTQQMGRYAMLCYA